MMALEAELAVRESEFLRIGPIGERKLRPIASRHRDGAETGCRRRSPAAAQGREQSATAEVQMLRRCQLHHSHAAMLAPRFRIRNVRISTRLGCPPSASRRKDTLERNAEVEHQIGLHIVMRLRPAGAADSAGRKT